jgi:hypothetical protein
LKSLAATITQSLASRPPHSLSDSAPASPVHTDHDRSRRHACQHRRCQSCCCSE